jgi:hypothetical protein
MSSALKGKLTPQIFGKLPIANQKFRLKEIKSSFKYIFLLSKYQTFKIYGTPIPWKEQSPVRALLIASSYATDFQ